MPASFENLAASLEVLKALQDQHIIAIRSAQLSRTHRERLLKNGYLREVVKGWYIPTRPDETPNESTTWFTSFWAFCASYLTQRFGKDWCLGPEQSLALFAGDWTVPKQLQVRSPKGGNKPLLLLHDTKLFDVRLPVPPAQNVEVNQGLRVFRLPAALINCSPTLFNAQPIVMRAALAAIIDVSELLRMLLDGSNNTIAGRLAGAFRNIGRTSIADNIVATMRAAGYTVIETDPFKGVASAIIKPRETSPHINRVTMTWQKMRDEVFANFPPPPTSKISKTAYLRRVDDLFVNDAYNSLSIEGYKVSADMIERVRLGQSNPDAISTDRNQRDALAARGYWQAFVRVKESVAKVLSKENAGKVTKADHALWYRELFAPSVVAGLIKSADLAGYRNGAVYIRHSQHIPPSHATVRELMPAFFDLLQREPEPAVRVVLGHFIFVYIHPYFDGNGRIARFLMNVMCASGGYPWIIIPVEKRREYMAALEQASTKGNLIPFARFLAAIVDASGD